MDHLWLRSLEEGLDAGRLAEPRPLSLPNLLNDLETLGSLLVERAAAGDVLDAFLLAAGMQQITEDHLHRDRFFLDRADHMLGARLPDPWGRVAAGAIRTASFVLWHVGVRTPGHRAARAWLSELDRLTESLAAGVLAAGAGEGSPMPAAADAAARAVHSRLRGLPRPLRRDLLRLPACFRSFDQSPDDMETLVQAFARDWPQTDRPLLVMGVRSSGGYLAALVGAALRRRGYGDVTVRTLRPGRRWLAREARLLRRVAARGAMALVIHDPPRSWGSFAGAVRELGELGFAAVDTVLLLATFADTVPRPAALQQLAAVPLPSSDWAVRRLLQPDRVHRSLAGLLEGKAEVLAVRPTGDLPADIDRGHVQAVYEVDLSVAGDTRRCLVRARGVGLGYLGAHALTLAAELRGRVATVLGLDRGLLYEVWSPPDSRLREPLLQHEATAIASYVAERARALPLSHDLTAHLRHRGTAWEWAGQPLGGLLGRPAELGRPLGVAVARRLLAVERAAVIDNRTQLQAFAQDSNVRAVVKSDFDLGVFTSDDFCCFDPLSDVALAAVSARNAAAGERLRRAYEKATGRPVAPERWLLYQLVHVLLAHRKEPAARRHTDLRPSRLLLAYYREVLLADVEPAASGPLCALDLDGVLETMPLGFSATSPAGAMALRALNRHGYRPVLATGRSFDEVRDRCAAYGVVAGVAEYGAVVYVAGAKKVHVLLGRAESQAQDRLRATLSGVPDVHIDPAFRYLVRAFCLDDSGRRRGLPEARVARALAASGTEGVLRPVPGAYQTDFIAVGTGKAGGLRLVAEELGEGGEPPLALAVGNTLEDLEMLRLAALGVAPGNAEPVVRSAPGVRAVRPPAQAGVAKAVGRLIGHPPGGCAVCAPPPISSSSRLLLDLMGLQDLPPWRQVLRALLLLGAARDQRT